MMLGTFSRCLPAPAKQWLDRFAFFAVPVPHQREQKTIACRQLKGSSIKASETRGMLCEHKRQYFTALFPQKRGDS